MKQGFTLAMMIVTPVLMAPPVLAQNFTTQAEVQPILEMTRAHWVGLGTATGADLLYFTHVLSWRCGIAEIRYGLNGATPDQVLSMEPCHRDTRQPNEIRDLPYVSFPRASVMSVAVQLRFEDGQVLEQIFDRADIRID